MAAPSVSSIVFVFFLHLIIPFESIFGQISSSSSPSSTDSVKKCPDFENVYPFNGTKNCLYISKDVFNGTRTEADRSCNDLPYGESVWRLPMVDNDTKNDELYKIIVTMIASNRTVNGTFWIGLLREPAHPDEAKLQWGNTVRWLWFNHSSLHSGGISHSLVVWRLDNEKYKKNMSGGEMENCVWAELVHGERRTNWFDDLCSEVIHGPLICETDLTPQSTTTSSTTTTTEKTTTQTTSSAIQSKLTASRLMAKWPTTESSKSFFPWQWGLLVAGALVAVLCAFVIVAMIVRMKRRRQLGGGTKAAKSRRDEVTQTQTLTPTLTPTPTTSATAQSGSLQPESAATSMSLFDQSRRPAGRFRSRKSIKKFKWPKKSNSGMPAKSKSGQSLKSKSGQPFKSKAALAAQGKS